MTAPPPRATGVEGADVGAPGAVEHAYARQGSYAITTTTTYDLTFVLPGQGAQTIPLDLPAEPARDPAGARDPDPRRLRPLSRRASTAYDAGARLRA